MTATHDRKNNIKFIELKCVSQLSITILCTFQGNPDGWKTVPSRRVDPRSLAIMKEKDDGDVKLGPGAGLSKWTQGCRTKGREGGDRVSATKYVLFLISVL